MIRWISVLQYKEEIEKYLYPRNIIIPYDNLNIVESHLAIKKNVLLEV